METCNKKSENMFYNRSFVLNLEKDNFINWSLQYYTIPLLYFIAFNFLKFDFDLIYLLAIIFIIIPLLDDMIEYDFKNPNKEETKKLEKDQRFKLPLYISVFLDWLFTIYAIKLLVTRDYSIYSQLIIVLSAGLLSTSNFNICHELCHKIERGDNLDYLIGMAGISKSMYMYWVTEHNFGHHKNVSTPLDAATAFKDQTLYQFFPQTLIGTFKSAWNLECEAMKKQDKTIESNFHYKNKFLWYKAIQLAVLYIFYLNGGSWAVIYLLSQAIISILILEIINYIEHYGLSRKKLENGQYEQVTDMHSWNSPQRFTNYLLFKIQRHSDHHANSTKPYQVLLSQEHSPTLPHGYTIILLMALFPSVYIPIMNDCLYLHYGKKQCQKLFYSIQQRTSAFLKRIIQLFTLVVIVSSLF